MPKLRIAAEDRFRVYLSGPMSSLTYAEASGWRKALINRTRRNQLSSTVITFISPLRGKKQNAFCHSWETNNKVARKLGWTPDRIFNRDFDDVRRCDLMVVNLDKMSMGTLVELGWASAWGIPMLFLVTNMKALDQKWLAHPFVSHLIRKHNKSRKPFMFLYKDFSGNSSLLTDALDGLTPRLVKLAKQHARSHTSRVITV